MTEPAHDMKIEQKYVLVFDFCSSTVILESLIQSERIVHWRNLLIEIKKFLQAERDIHGFEVYKFIGDGWIIFFPVNFSPTEMFSFMKRLSDKYLAVYKREVRPVLAKSLNNVGVTFGLDKGSVIRFQLLTKREYIGRPLNMAARLQGAVAGKDGAPAQNRVLMTKSAYHDLKGEISKVYKPVTVKRTLKNVSGGESCLYIKVWLDAKPLSPQQAIS